MKTRILALAALLSISILSSTAQEDNNGKKIYAKSYLNQKAPELKVGMWLTSRPDTVGKFVLIDFWATWCGPCRKAIPELNEISKQFKDDMVVIGISNESPSKVLAMTEPVIEYASAIDTTATTFKQYEIKGIPHVVIIDPKGIVRWEGFPLLEGHQLTPQVVESLIKKYKTSPAEK